MKTNIDSHAKGLHNLLRILTYLLALPIATFFSLFCVPMVWFALIGFQPLMVLFGLAGLCGTYGLFLAAMAIHPTRAALCMLAGMVAMFPAVPHVEFQRQWIVAPFWIALLHQIVFVIRHLHRRTA